MKRRHGTNIGLGSQRFEYESPAPGAPDLIPNIAQVYEAARHEGTARGRALLRHGVHPQCSVPITGEYADEPSKLGTRERLELFQRKSATPSITAHQKGIIHRDLKPGNILVDSQSDQAVPKIIDFGVARGHRLGPGHGHAADRVGQISSARCST